VRVKQTAEEVLVTEDRIVKLGSDYLQSLQESAKLTARQRIRLCAHGDTGDKLHEMFIVHQKNTYVRPHKHLGKSESIHVIQGSVDVVVFGEDGEVGEVIQLGDYASGRDFFCRISDPCYHTLLITSEDLVFNETTSGPFLRADTIWAPWSPVEGDTSAVQAFMTRLASNVEALKVTPVDVGGPG
jgi:cupin fold WbuC family metalloprotein